MVDLINSFSMMTEPATAKLVGYIVSYGMIRFFLYHIEILFNCLFQILSLISFLSIFSGLCVIRSHCYWRQIARCELHIFYFCFDCCLCVCVCFLRGRIFFLFYFLSYYCYDIMQDFYFEVQSIVTFEKIHMKFFLKAS